MVKQEKNVDGKARENRITEKDTIPEKISRYARVTRLATDQSSDEEATNHKLEQVDSGLLKRIRKMLKLAQHPNTTEAEAKQALRASTRMLSAANLTEAEVMSRESVEEQAQRAGHSIVTIRHRDGKQVSLEQWSITLGHAINLAFNVKYFHTSWSSHDRIEFTFYGLRDNTVAAVISFEAVFNLALAWVVDRKDVKGRTGKNSYLLGFSSSLYKMAKKEKKDEEEKALEAEKRATLKDEMESDKMKSAERLRLHASNVKSATVADEDADEDADEIIFLGIQHGRKREADDIKVKDEVLSSDGGEMDHPNLSRGIEVDGYDDDDDGSDVDFTDARDSEGEEGEEEVGDVKTEQERFDAAFDRHAHPFVLAERPINNLAVKQENLEDINVKQENEKEGELAMKDEKEDEKVKIERNGEEETEVAAWQSQAQLIIFKETAARIADDYLKVIEKKVRTRKARKNTSLHDPSAYEKGQEDARKVDLKRRRLEGG